MAVKTKTPTPTTSTAPRIPAPASPAAQAPGTRPSASAAASRLAVSPQAVSTSQQRRSAAQTPAPVPRAQKEKTPITLPPGLNAQEKKDAGLIGRVLDTAPKFAELVANRAASGQLSSKQLNDLAYIAKQGQVHGRTDQQVRASLEKAMKGMLPNAVPAGQNQGLSGRPSSNATATPSIGMGLGQKLGALLNYDIGDALVQRVNTAGIQWATARGNQELAQFLKDDLAAHNHLKEVGLAGAAGEVARALPGEFQNGRGQYSVGSIAAGVGNLSGLGDAKGLITGTDFKGRPVNPYQGALNIGLGAATGVVGRSSIGGIGQAATRTLNTVSAKGNQVLDTMAYGLFGGGPGPGAALAYAGGGVGGAALNGGRSLGNFSKAQGLSGAAGANLATRSGEGGNSLGGKVSTEQARSMIESRIQQMFKGDQGKIRDITNAVKGLSPEDIQALYSIKDIEAAGLKVVLSQIKVKTIRPAALQSIHGAAERVALGQEVILEPSLLTGYPEFSTGKAKKVDIDLATRADGKWQEGVQYYKPENVENIAALPDKITRKADKQLINSPTPRTTMEVDLRNIASTEFPGIDLKPGTPYEIVIHFSDETVTYRK